MPTLLLIRHAQASFGSEDYDRLSERGLEQVTALAAGLAARGVKVGPVIAGSLKRQIDTAVPWADPVRMDPRLNEYDTEAVMTAHSDAAVGLENNPGDSRDFQVLLDAALTAWVEAGDSWRTFRDDAVAAVEEFAATIPSGETGLVFTSGGVIGALAAHFWELPDMGFVTINRVTVNTGISKLVIGRAGRSLVTFNEHAHLEAGGLVTYR